MALVPVFPLSTPLLPQCILPLQIFEPRYLDMVARCMKEDSGFVITQLVQGSEVGKGNGDFFPVGTYVRITDFSQRDNGLLAITVTGEIRMSLTGIRQQNDGLWLAEGDELPERGEPDLTELDSLVDLLGKLVAHDLMAHIRSEVDIAQPIQVMNYLVMLLPITPHQKQALMETDHLGLRWSNLLECIARLEEKANQ